MTKREEACNDGFYTVLLIFPLEVILQTLKSR